MVQDFIAYVMHSNQTRMYENHLNNGLADSIVNVGPVSDGLSQFYIHPRAIGHYNVTGIVPVGSAEV